MFGIQFKAPKLGIAAGARPPAAVELAPEGVLAASLPARGAAPVYAFAPLRPGALAPGLAETNLVARDQVVAALRSALDQVSPRTHAVTVVVPDRAVRVFVLDFDTMPAKLAEALSVLRFRLRKMVPFDVEHAGVSYQILSQSPTECRALICVIPGPVLDEYESAVREAGYEPGAVLPSSLAALAAVDASEPALAACLNSATLTTAIAQGNDLLLYRTIELPQDPAQKLAEVQRHIAVASAYYEDKISAAPRRLLYAGIGDAAAFAAWINDPMLTVAELTGRPATGAATALGPISTAPVAGALAGSSAYAGAI